MAAAQLSARAIFGVVGHTRHTVMLTKCADTEDTKVEEPAYHQVRRVPGDQPTERPPQGQR